MALEDVLLLLLVQRVEGLFASGIVIVLVLAAAVAADPARLAEVAVIAPVSGPFAEVLLPPVSLVLALLYHCLFGELPLLQVLFLRDSGKRAAQQMVVHIFTVARVCASHEGVRTNYLRGKVPEFQNTSTHVTN